MFGHEKNARLEGRDFRRVGEASQPRLHGLARQEHAGLFRIGRRAAGLDRDLVEQQRSHCLHALPAAMPFQRGNFAQAFREQVEQPLGLDSACQPDHGRFLVLAILGFHRHQQLRAGHRAVGRLLRRQRRWPIAVATPCRRRATRSGNAVRMLSSSASSRSAAGPAMRAPDASQLTEQPRRIRRPLPFRPAPEGPIARRASRARAVDRPRRSTPPPHSPRERRPDAALPPCRRLKRGCKG